MSLFLLLGLSAHAQDSWNPTVDDAKYVNIGEKAATITPATSADDNSHWYIICQKRLGESPLYNTGNTILKRAASTVTPGSLSGTTVAESKQYLVRFIKNTEVAEEGVYKVQFANGDYITSDLTAGTPGADFYFYNINNMDTHFGWNLYDYGVYANIVDNNGAGNTLAYWERDKVNEVGGNNDWSVYPVTFAEAVVNVTYIVKMNGKTIKQTIVQQAVGSPTKLPDVLVNEFCDYTYDIATIPNTNTTVTATATTSATSPIVFSSSFETATWYNLILRNESYPAYNSSATPNVTNPEVQGESSDPANQWAFVGTPYRFSIYNKAAGNALTLATPTSTNSADTGGTTFAVMTSDYVTNPNHEWEIKGSTYAANGFYLFNDEGHALNHRGNVGVSYWTGGYDSGSTFTVTEVVATGINQVSKDVNDKNAPVYNLAGQRVNKPAQGVYIQNGKKFVVK